MIPELAARLRHATLAQVQGYRRMRVRQGNNIIARWHIAQETDQQYPEWPGMQQEWQTAQMVRAQYERGLAEVDAIIAEKEAA